MHGRTDFLQGATFNPWEVGFDGTRDGRQKPGIGKTVLAVDDNAAIRKTLAAVFFAHSHLVRLSKRSFDSFLLCYVGSPISLAADVR